MREVTYNNVNSFNVSATLTRIVKFLLAIVEALLAIRLVLRLIGAGTASGFTNFIYSVTHPLVAPFFNIVRNYATGTGVLEWATIIGMVVYYLVAWALIKMFWLGSTRRTYFRSYDQRVGDTRYDGYDTPKYTV